MLPRYYRATGLDWITEDEARNMIGMSMLVQVPGAPF
jgi:hypothetical protein